MTAFSSILAQTLPTPGETPSHILLSLLIFTPLIGGLLLLLAHKLHPTLSRLLGLCFSLTTLLFGAGATIIMMEWLGTAPMIKIPPHLNPVKIQEGEAVTQSFLGFNYHLGLDAISLLLVLLTGIIAPMCLLASWKVKRPQIFFGLILLTQGAALGVFLSLNFFLWFLFWELSLFPMFFLIKLWGGPGAQRAAYQFVLYTIGGSAFMLLAFAAIYAATGTVDFARLSAMANVYGPSILNENLAVLGGAVPMLVFLGVLVGLAVKVPMYPFHTWLPATYAEAPVGASMFLTAILSKMGIFGVHRILWPNFGEQLKAGAPILIWLSLAGVVLGAYAALRQTDLKRMIAYSSINHLSYCLLAIFAVYSATSGTQADADSAFAGTLLQMFNHGLSAAALFFCIGVLEDRTGLRGLNDFGGVRKVAPLFTTFCGIAMFSSLGLPGLNGFVSEFLIFRGVFGVKPWAAAIACLGLLGTAVFFLNFWQKVFHGPTAANSAKVADLSLREVLVLAPVTVLMFVIGLWPQSLLSLIQSKFF